MTDPFNVADHLKALINTSISTEMKASINVHDSLLKSLERGNQMVKSFVEGCSNESETHAFYSPICKEGGRRWVKCYGCFCKHEQHLDQTDAPKTHAPHITHAPHATNAPHKTHAPVVTHSPFTTKPTHTSACDIVAIFDAVARNQFVHNSRAAQCPNDDGHHDNDALVMTLCNAPVSSEWVEGEQVLLRNGTCSELAKPYTPVFYHPRENVRHAGILISCDGNEIRVKLEIIMEIETTVLKDLVDGMIVKDANVNMILVVNSIVTIVLKDPVCGLFVMAAIVNMNIILVECMYCMHCHPGQVECEVQTHAPLPAVTDAPITTSKPHSSRCDIVGIFGAVARNQFIQNLQAITCQPDKGQHDNDALVMTLCSAPESSKWIEGEQVLLRNGTCSESAKPYTPIFYHRENVRRAGILISCDGSEIRFIIIMTMTVQADQIHGTLVMTAIVDMIITQVCLSVIDFYCKHEHHSDQTNPPVTTHVPLTTTEPHSSTCDIVKIFDAVARNQFIHNAQGSICQNDNEPHDNDALVMTLCNAPVSSMWIDGEQVLLSSGSCSQSAKPYTPIFYHLGNVRRAGILISCDGNEIRVVFPSRMRYNSSGEACEFNTNRQDTRADMDLNLK
ncbi:unnamed protein product [Mytilus coruscus]|uniref:Uncharacterized protein n=1 Tax=Mytilus coruscus TaxID=42192 RepID=A0A6J8DVC1_MYTCO|nr:unnamed protein product [Mytilus coruscus]